jgi:anti-sigma regulatory factor (Ser/Thr protein kinase)
LTTAELMTAETRQNDVDSERRNAPPYCDRHVFVSALLTPTEARISIRDEGPGFDVAGLSRSRSTPEQLISGERRGLVLIRAFLDDVQFNQAGNEITLIKRKQAV